MTGKGGSCLERTSSSNSTRPVSERNRVEKRRAVNEKPAGSEKSAPHSAYVRSGMDVQPVSRYVWFRTRF